MIKFTTNPAEWLFADAPDHCKIVEIKPPSKLYPDYWQVIYTLQTGRVRCQQLYDPKQNGISFDRQPRFKLIRNKVT